MIRFCNSRWAWAVTACAYLLATAIRLAHGPGLPPDPWQG